MCEQVECTVWSELRFSSFSAEGEVISSERSSVASEFVSVLSITYQKFRESKHIRFTCRGVLNITAGSVPNVKV